MCSIIGSFDSDYIVGLYLLNKSRGNFSHSISYIDPITTDFNIIKQDFGEVDNLYDIVSSQEFKNKYIVMHNQAPTGGLIKNDAYIHPAHIQDKNTNHYLYHNGIVKTRDMVRLERLLNQKFEWDTYAILADIIENGLLGSLKFLDASFACLYIKQGNEVLLFRNKSSIIYYDENLTISSQKFENSIELPPNNLFQLNFNTKQLVIVDSFKNIDDKYFFAS
jgi:glucosamine 6-phosphate synthetase-like amidotransferase/phosphosugar isomerase protein